MLRSVLILIALAAASFLLTQRSLEAPALHFLFTPFWSLLFFFAWRSRQWAVLAAGAAIFLGWQIYFGIHAGFSLLPLLWGICMLLSASLILVDLIFKARVKKRSVLSAEKGRELAALRKKFDSRQQSLEHLENQVASLLNLFEIARELSEAIDFSGLAESLSKTLRNELAFSRVSLWMPQINKETGAKCFRGMIVNRESSPEIDPPPPPEALLSQLEQGRQMVRENNAWYFPAFDQNELYAIFAIQDAEEKDLAKIEVLSSFLALLIKKISLYETIRELAIIDDLTQVFVRRHFMERLTEEIKRSQRFKTPLSLLMLDIDHFKRYNDDFGHLVGDATLKKVAEIIKVNVRRVDLVGRYGGEEFIVVMPETRQKDAQDIAERIRSHIARHIFKVYHVETKVTVSQGIAVYDPQNSALGLGAEPGLVVDRLIQAADKCLYQAKEDGRNRVMICKDWI